MVSIQSLCEERKKLLYDNLDGMINLYKIIKSHYYYYQSVQFSVSASPLPLVPSAQTGDILCTYDWILFPGN